MALAIFNPSVMPSIQGYSDAPEFNIREVEFGDGYTAPEPQGLNHIRRVITVNWRLLTEAQSAEIIDFIREQGGYRAFWWTPPGEPKALKWTCKQYRKAKERRLRDQISATFRQTFTLEE